MSATVIRGESATGNYPTKIDDILRLREPHQTFAVMEFVGDADPYGVSEEDMVKVRTHDNKPMTVTFRGRKYNISPKGRNLPKSLAIELIRLYGKDGRYYMKDPLTGIDKRQFDGADEATRKKMGYHGQDLKFNTSYLTHDVGVVVEETDPYAEFSEPSTEE